MSSRDREDVLAELPGDLMMWVLIASELLVFGAGLAAFLAVRIGDPDGFAAAQERLDRTAGAVNTIVLVTSGYFAARAVAARTAGAQAGARLWLGAAGAAGLVFLGVKAVEYAGKAAAGIGTETHAFYMFYFLLTGFHAAHVVTGIIILALVAWADSLHNMETGVTFWHMVDLVWVRLCHVNAGWPRKSAFTEISGSCNLAPSDERLSSEVAERLAGYQVALQVELIVDGGMDGEEPLCRTGRFEAPARPFSPPGRLVRDLGRLFDLPPCT